MDSTVERRRRKSACRHAVALFGAAFALAGSGQWTEARAGADREQTLATRQPSQPEADPQSVSADARRSSAEFWAKLPADKSAELERELDRLEERARQGKPVEADLKKLQGRYPALFQHAAALKSVRWITAGSPGTTQVCTGILFVGKNGRTRCIGAYKAGG